MFKTFVKTVKRLRFLLSFQLLLDTRKIQSNAGRHPESINLALLGK